MRKTQFVFCLIVATLVVGNQFTQAADPAHPDQPIVPPAEAMSRLKEGNARFTAGNPQHPHDRLMKEVHGGQTAMKMLGRSRWA